MAKEEKSVRGAGRVAFWAREKEIKEMIDAKHTKRNIYRRYGAEMNISYEQFARYVSKFITNKPTPAKEPVKKEVEKEKVAEKIRSDPNFISNALKYDPDRPKEDLT